MDRIIIKDLEVYAFHGVAPEEQKLGQMFLLSIDISTDLEEVACSGNLELGISYAEVCNIAKEIMQKQKYELIETAAIKVIEGIFRKFDKAQVVKVLLKKPWAPMGHHVKYAAVELQRSRADRNEW